MEEIISKLIEVDKNARRRVAETRAKRGEAVREIEETKKLLEKENAEKFESALEAERQKQEKLLNEKRAHIAQKTDALVSQFQKLYEENCESWVQSLAESVTR